MMPIEKCGIVLLDGIGALTGFVSFLDIWISEFTHYVD
jgi:hypothetical protein